MTQLQGSRTASGGRLDGSNATEVTAANFAIGVGWGGTATFTITDDSTDQCGQIVITASTTTPAQATATVTLTFADGAYGGTAPIPMVTLASSTQAVNDPQPTAVVATTTALSWTSGVLPVATKVYTFNYILVAKGR
jgi:hypothetical protein